MTVNYNVTGIERKRMADAIAGFLGCEKKYLGAPSFAYRAGYIEISKDGVITFDHRADSKEVEALLEELEQKGFHAEPANKSGNITQDTPLGLTISLPLEKVNMGNLTNLFDAKGSLIKEALGIDSLPIEITEDTITFSWFEELPEPDEADAYTRLIAAMCKMNKAQKRISPRAAEPDNKKYAFRWFLLRLGFIGDEYKSTRKILLRRLPGNSAWKGDAPSVE